MEIKPKELFSEPSGWESARISLGTALALVSIYAYFELLHTSGLVATLVIAFAAGLSGIAELLPTDQRYVASALRVTAIGILAILVILSLQRVVS
ncbi:hypothetical protein C481_05245 [Natrialba asiatica DSM 12278]|uniref:Uncharacterized protein n=1 Tax=Natrialba asiatica (strain ATCC 700177 / DSM 12278 / JCM 9576 / FERM P-10747 / NBRC 102637 / 172P1) TaxID=29540 RepID=M0B0Z7_NATA1|nr:hypothetical protein C481_05245 [Natrialba asiatica DSM 12278]